MKVNRGIAMPLSSLHLPAALIILDGFGLASSGTGNAISQAHTPVLDHLLADSPSVQLEASGEAVGLPAGQMGNSEVGHLNIGAGRVVHQELSRINEACRSGSIESNEVLLRAMETTRTRGSVLHLMGLVSDGGVHSSIDHLLALLNMAARNGVQQVFIHAFLDGRDVPPKSAEGYLRQVLDACEQHTAAGLQYQIASISGRYYAMDRDNRWDRVQAAWQAIAQAQPITTATPLEYLHSSYNDKVTDEFVIPVSFTERPMTDDDAVIFFNFRPDRARQLTRAFRDPTFDGFTGANCHPTFVCLTEYDPRIPADVAFPKEFPQMVLADAIAAAGLTQYHIAETEKYAHVTFFLNGGREEPKKGEKRVLIPSPKVATYDLQPEMSEEEVSSTLAQAIDNDEADFYLVNFANCDMVGHTGSVPATVQAVEAVDRGVGRVLAALKRKQGVALLTADHGNADKMLAADGSPHTAHTTAPVPLVLIDYAETGFSFSPDAQAGKGALCNIAPTLLDMAGVSIPSEMTASSLVRN